MWEENTGVIRPTAGLTAHFISVINKIYTHITSLIY